MWQRYLHYNNLNGELANHKNWKFHFRSYLYINPNWHYFQFILVSPIWKTFQQHESLSFLFFRYCSRNSKNNWTYSNNFRYLWTTNSLNKASDWNFNVCLCICYDFIRCINFEKYDRIFFCIDKRRQLIANKSTFYFIFDIVPTHSDICRNSNPESTLINYTLQIPVSTCWNILFRDFISCFCIFIYAHNPKKSIIIFIRKLESSKGVYNTKNKKNHNNIPNCHHILYNNFSFLSFNTNNHFLDLGLDDFRITYFNIDPRYTLFNSTWILYK